MYYCLNFGSSNIQMEGFYPPTRVLWTMCRKFGMEVIRLFNVYASVPSLRGDGGGGGQHTLSKQTADLRQDRSSHYRRKSKHTPNWSRIQHHGNPVGYSLLNVMYVKGKTRSTNPITLVRIEPAIKQSQDRILPSEPLQTTQSTREVTDKLILQQ